ncbi:MAG: ROK family protein [Proteobacteria bacterium]|nr:ROK family protein [Pseudomonadota bacterium]
MRIGIDLGGSKIEGLVLGPDGEELARARVQTPQDDYGATVAAVAGLVAELGSKSGADEGVAVGVGIPGVLSPATGLVKNANSTCLIGQALDKDLEEATGRPVRLANDADCFTISEATDGAGGNVDVVFGVILGTGCGGGVVVDGHLLRGPNAITGEWGHNPLPWPRTLAGGPDGIDERPGPECYCGQRGCIETFVSGPGLERDYEQEARKELGAEEIVALAESGDPAAEAALSRYEHRLARALASVINVLDPGMIVLGGGMSNAKRLYENVPKLWGQWVFSDTVATPLRPAAHGASSGVRGAAWLW